MKKTYINNEHNYAIYDADKQELMAVFTNTRMLMTFIWGVQITYSTGKLAYYLKAKKSCSENELGIRLAFRYWYKMDETPVNEWGYFLSEKYAHLDCKIPKQIGHWTTVNNRMGSMIKEKLKNKTTI